MAVRYFCDECGIESKITSFAIWADIGNVDGLKEEFPRYAGDL